MTCPSLQMVPDWGFRTLKCVDFKTAGDKMWPHLSSFLYSAMKIQKGFHVPAKSGLREGADTSKPMSQIYNYDPTRDMVSSKGHL